MNVTRVAKPKLTTATTMILYSTIASPLRSPRPVAATAAPRPGIFTLVTAAGAAPSDVVTLSKS